MKRREFITLLGSATAVLPLAARAQEAGRFARIGVLGPGLDNPVTGPGYQTFLSELRKLGFTEGQNVIVEYRRTDEGLPKAFTGANELVAAKADVRALREKQARIGDQIRKWQDEYERFRTGTTPALGDVGVLTLVKG